MELGSLFSPFNAQLSPQAAGGQRASSGNLSSPQAVQPSGTLEAGGATTATGEPLTREQAEQVRDLQQRDAEVRAHEQAHASVGGPYASAPSYTYTQGPDGRRYATGGEVQIDTSPERTPEATIRKMDIVIRAALAPAEPSSQDRTVARTAQQQRQEAQNQIAQGEGGETTPLQEAQNEATEGEETDGLNTNIIAQILGQSGDDGGSASSATALSAYNQAANLTQQIFGAINA